MNKYDFDFKRIEDVLYDVLGIVNPNDIVSLKMQIRDSLNALSNAIDDKYSDFGDVNQEKNEFQKNTLYKELDSIATETDLDVILKKCVIVKSLTLLSLDVKIREEDSYEVKAQKKLRRSEIFAVSDLLKSVSSITELMKGRNLLLRNISINHDNSFNNYSIYTQNDQFPEIKLDIQFQQKQTDLPKKYKDYFEKYGIYASIYGDVFCYSNPDENGNYSQIISNKKIIGIIKKDEFNELKRYSILMDDFSQDVELDFYRDIAFSDMVLRYANSNMGILGIPEKSSNDTKYGYKLSFCNEKILDFSKAIHLEGNPNFVTVNSNISRVKSVSDTYILMQEKMEQVIKDRFSDSNERAMGD